MIIIDCTFVHFLCRQDDIVMFLTKVTENKMMKKKKKSNSSINRQNNWQIKTRLGWSPHWSEPISLWAHTGCQSEIIVNGKRLPLSIGRFSPASPWRQGSSGQKAGKPIGRRSDLRKPWPWEHGGLLRNISKYSLQLTPFLPLSRFARHTTTPSLNLDWTARYEQLYMWKWFEPWAIIYIIRWQWNFQMSTCPQNWSSN